MCLHHVRRPRLVLALSALSALFALFAVPGTAAAAAGPAGAGAEVARLYAEAARATEAYEQGRRAAAVQRALATRLQGELTAKRRALTVLRDRAGEVARLQYRSGGSLTLTAGVLFADDPDEAMRSRFVSWQTNRSVNRLLDRTHEAEGDLARAERRAREAWRDLDGRRARLGAIRRGIETRLERAQWRLSAEADRSVSAGRCGNTVRLAPPESLPSPGRPWVAPVTGYELTAGFDSAGRHWARRHTGQDFAVDVGTPVRTIGAGRVESVSCGGAFGIEVLVRHEGGWYSQYAHLAAAGVREGERLRAGQWIGQAGSTGNSTGPHLHFEMRLTPRLGSGVDPVRWLREHGVRLRGAP